MNAELERAFLVRQNNHLVYRLANRQNFVVAKTSSDPERAPARESLPEQRDSLQKRIEAAIGGEETQLEKVMAEAQQIERRVQMLRALLPFKVNDVLSLMAGERQIDALERTRIRTSIAQAMISLYERGELIREAEGKGRRQAIWRKAGLNGHTVRA